jgi:hypothetical protein
MVWDLKIYFYVNLYADNYSVSEIWSGSSSFRCAEGRYVWDDGEK